MNKKRVQEILNKKIESILNIPITESIFETVNLIKGCSGKLVFSGMGKAGLIARKIASTFSSTGTPSIFLHPAEAQHGDLGLLDNKDILIVFSNSGKTREIIELVELTRVFENRIKIIAVTSNSNNDVSLLSDLTLEIGVVEEVCPIGLAPTTSTTNMLVLGDILAILTMEEKGITKEDFFKRHHGGYLGTKK
jgi:arabinose-5-phosphate isomerase